MLARILRRLRRRPMLALGLLVVALAIPAGLAAAPHLRPPGLLAAAGAAPALTEAAADRFVAAYASFDADGLYAALCPEQQAATSLPALRSAALRAQAARAGETNTVELVGVRARAGGGEVRFYLVTVSAPGEPPVQVSWVVRTQADGCVEQWE